MVEFKQGDVVENRKAKDSDPTKRFIYVKSLKNGIVGLELHNGLQKMAYPRKTVEEVLDDGHPALVKVGHTKAYRNLIDELKDWNRGVK